ncbi:MAG: class I SAM-dependent methyltransferase [Deltaproteobacteria bacterium]|nr:MAG: class I SAM-dependent methyltransferase [Deltaproteobacteria bacterium]
MPALNHPSILLLDALADELDGTWIAAHDDGRVARALADRGAEVHRYHRYVDGDGPASAMPPQVQADRVTLSLPRGRPAFAFALESLASRMAPGARLYVYGANDAGVKSAHKALEPWFDDVEKLDARKHGRLLGAVRTDAPARGSLEEYAEHATLALPGGDVSFTHYPGLFNKGALDEGTELLLGALDKIERPVRKALDFACGMGVIAANVHQRWPDAEIHALDADALAVEATRQVLPEARVVLSDSYSGLSQIDGAGRYDLIVSNPPLHSGTSLDLRVLQELVTQAGQWLHRKGTLALVVQRQRPLPDLPGKQARLLADDGRYRVWALS